MVSSYLKARGFQAVEDKRRLYGRTESQTITAATSDGHRMVMRVRLCWRRNRRRSVGREYSAAQLMARIENGDWEGSVNAKVVNQREEGVTHLLLVQREDETIRMAALIPLSAVLPIWRAQRDTSAALIARGELGRRKKNHAMNGSSPTLWLSDDAAPSVGYQLWNYPGVIDLEHKPNVAAPGIARIDDTYDDLPGTDIAFLGRDNPRTYVRERSFVARDVRVRSAVLERAAGSCERTGCDESRNFAAFLDVHHILGAAKSDRVNNCVAVCPNCHREAHYAPNRDEINASLLKVARRASTAGTINRRP
jgi:5-methylcytosine-specific restriction enzyme A